MRISFTNPIEVQTENGMVACSEAEVSVAISNSAAIRVVPVDGEGKEHPAASIGIVGTPEQEEISTLMNTVSSAIRDLMGSRGL